MRPACMRRNSNNSRLHNLVYQHNEYYACRTVFLEIYAAHFQ